MGGVEITLTTDFKEAQQLLDDLGAGGLDPGDKLMQTILVAMRSIVGSVVFHVLRHKLSGQVLNRVTGTLQRNVAASQRVTAKGNIVEGAYGTNLGYGVAHEIGFKGDVSIAAHTVKAHRRRAHARRNPRGGTAMQVKAHTVAAHQVQAYIAGRNISAKHYLRDGLRESKADADARLTRALQILLKQDRVPNINEIRSLGGA